MLPRQSLNTVDYEEELNRIKADKMRFEARIARVATGRKLEDLVEKYRAYIKDLLLRPDSKAASLCNSLLPVVSRITILKASAFHRLVEGKVSLAKPAQHKQKNLEIIATLGVWTQTKQKLRLLDAFRTICEQCRPTSKIPALKAFVRTFNNIKLRQCRNLFTSIELATCFTNFKAQLNLKDSRILELQEQIVKLKESSSKSPNYSTICQDSEQRIIALDRTIREKQRDIKNLVKMNKELEAKYEFRIEKLEEEVNKMSLINSKLIEDIEELRQRRGEFSDIANQPDNSISMEIFSQKQDQQNLEMELSDKYLRQVICLKENIESIKTNFLALLQSNLKLQRNLLTNLMYLLNFNEQEKIMARQNPLIAQLLQ